MSMGIQNTAGWHGVIDTAINTRNRYNACCNSVEGNTPLIRVLILFGK